MLEHNGCIQSLGLSVLNGWWDITSKREKMQWKCSSFNLLMKNLGHNTIKLTPIYNDPSEHSTSYVETFTFKKIFSVPCATREDLCWLCSEDKNRQGQVQKKKKKARQQCSKRKTKKKWHGWDLNPRTRGTRRLLKRKVFEP